MRKSANHEMICWNILPAVSRSFALCIQKLPKGLDERMMAAYLILRVIDTIEDSSAPIEIKRAALGQFLDLLDDEGPVNRIKVQTFRGFLLANIDHSYERILLENVASLLEVHHAFSGDERRAINECAREMSRGMLEFQGKPIRDLKTQEAYCHYVAGIVGHLNTRLFHLAGEITPELRDRIMGLARNFGVALQKVNILRDVADDVTHRRYFWPADVLEKNGLTYATLCLPENRARAMRALDVIVADALPYLEDALKYVTLLPRGAVRIRVFCLIPLFMALESYAKCVGNPDIFDTGKTVKISKGDVARIVRNSFLFSMSNMAIRRWFDSCAGDVRRKLARGAG